LSTIRYPATWSQAKDTRPFGSEAGPRLHRRSCRYKRSLGAMARFQIRGQACSRSAGLVIDDSGDGGCEAWSAASNLNALWRVPSGPGSSPAALPTRPDRSPALGRPRLFVVAPSPWCGPKRVSARGPCGERSERAVTQCHGESGAGNDPSRAGADAKGAACDRSVSLDSERSSAGPGRVALLALYGRACGRRARHEAASGRRLRTAPCSLHLSARSGASSFAAWTPEFDPRPWIDGMNPAGRLAASASGRPAPMAGGVPV